MAAKQNKRRWVYFQISDVPPPGDDHIHVELDALPTVVRVAVGMSPVPYGPEQIEVVGMGVGQKGVAEIVPKSD